MILEVGQAWQDEIPATRGIGFRGANNPAWDVRARSKAMGWG
jgi:hypothetical protein